jgi:hypothetical protein
MGLSVTLEVGYLKDHHYHLFYLVLHVVEFEMSFPMGAAM